VCWKRIEKERGPKPLTQPKPSHPAQPTSFLSRGPFASTFTWPSWLSLPSPLPGLPRATRPDPPRAPARSSPSQRARSHPSANWTPRVSRISPPARASPPLSPRARLSSPSPPPSFSSAPAKPISPPEISPAPNRTEAQDHRRPIIGPRGPPSTHTPSQRRHKP